MSGKTGDATAARNQPVQGQGAVGRRDVLLALMGVCSGVLVYASAGLADLRPKSEALGDWLRSRGIGLFSDLTALRRLGAIYLVAHPEESSRTVLSQLLIAGDEGTILSRLLSAIDRDWSSHRVAVVDGWLLARTEARLCAALHLEEAGPA
ncbi:MAG TPA: hypothetical protein VGV09_19590 [Steroidobacteraceae bacterium]|nr:hypothetical protein [Steroidobacteraceae bacterium]